MGSFLRGDILKTPRVEGIDTLLFLVIFITKIALCAGARVRPDVAVQAHQGSWSLPGRAAELPDSLYTSEVRQTELACRSDVLIVC